MNTILLDIYTNRSSTGMRNKNHLPKSTIFVIFRSFNKWGMFEQTNNGTAEYNTNPAGSKLQKFFLGKWFEYRR